MPPAGGQPFQQGPAFGGGNQFPPQQGGFQGGGQYPQPGAQAPGGAGPYPQPGQYGQQPGAFPPQGNPFGGPASPPPQQQGGGEFTRMFGAVTPAAGPPQPQPPIGMQAPAAHGATQAFNVQPGGGQQPMAFGGQPQAQQGPSEFTRMFQAQQQPMGMPQAAPPAPAPVVEVPAKKMGWLPFVILGVLFLVSLAVIVFFATRSK